PGARFRHPPHHEPAARRAVREVDRDEAARRPGGRFIRSLRRHGSRARFRGSASGLPPGWFREGGGQRGGEASRGISRLAGERDRRRSQVRMTPGRAESKEPQISDSYTLVLLAVILAIAA